MKKFNIFALFSAFIMQFMFLPLIEAQSISNSNATTVDIYYALYRKTSSNGKFAIGNVSGMYGFILNLETETRVDLPNPGSEANSVTNDGIVFGLYLNKPAYFEIDWEEGEAVPTFLPMPEYNGQVANKVTIHNVSADGSICVGYVDDKFEYQTSGVIWDLLAETVYLVEKPTINENIRLDYFFPSHVSDDGNILSGRIHFAFESSDESEEYSKFEVGLWNREGDFLGYIHDALDPNNEIKGLRQTNISRNGRYIVGEATYVKFNPVIGGEMAITYPFVYDMQNKELKVMKDIDPGFNQFASFEAVSNDGVLFGFTDLVAGMNFWGSAITHVNGKTYLLEDWLKEFYQTDLKVTTGTPFDCNADGNVIVGNGYITEENGLRACGYIIQLGGIKSCPRPENMYAEVLGNETITINWKAPSEQYEANVKGYNVYRDDKLINLNLLEDLSFNEILTDIGVYYYCVQAVYDDGCTSGKTDLQAVEIFPQGSCYSPNELTGYVMQNEEKSINLLWEYPDFDVRFDSGTPKSAWSNEGRPIYFAIKITREDITENLWNGFNMTDVSFFINAKSDYEFRMYKSKTPHRILVVDQSMELGYEQHLADKADFETGGKYSSYYDNFSKFNLDEPISLSDEYNYYITIVASNYGSDNVHPVVYDDQNTKAIGKSDLIFLPQTDDQNIIAFTSLAGNLPGYQGNWLLSAIITPVRETVTSIEDVPSLYDRAVDSYTIFRDGKEVATVNTNQYTDSKFEESNIEKSYTYNIVANYKYNCISEPTNDITVSRTSVDENLTSMINIYPNPVTGDRVFIDGEYSSVSISDIQGRTVCQSESVNGNFIDVKDLKSGIYFLKIYINDKNAVVKKLIVK